MLDHIDAATKVMSAWQKVRLETSDGKLVADVTIPELDPRPDVINWNARTFVKHQSHRPTYREGFAFTVGPIPGVDNNGF